MAEKKGFFRDPAPDMAMGFKEGNIEVLESSFRVVHPDTQAGGTDPGAHPALVWKVARLDEELKPLTHPETDEPLTEELEFSIGSKVLPNIHPGKADGPDDKDVEDAGTADGAEGNTLWFKPGVTIQIHAKSSARVLYASLEDGLKDDQGKFFFTGAGVNSKFTDRVWAPDWKGCLFHMKGFADANFLAMEGRKDPSKKFPVSYKIVDKIHRGPGEKGKGKTAASSGKSAEKSEKAGKGAGADGNGDVDPNVLALAKKALNKMSEDQSGKQLTFKLFWKAFGDTLTKVGADAELLMPTTQLVKDENWMAENLKDFDMTMDAKERQVSIG